MRRIGLVVGYIFAFVTVTRAQSCPENLVPNPSFEDTLPHPNKALEFKYLSNWTSPNSSTVDFFHVCNNFDFVNGVCVCNPSLCEISEGNPNNYVGYQHSYDNKGYIGVVFYFFDFINIGGIIIEYREYAQAKLKEPLKPCTQYELSFYVSLADTSNLATSLLQAAVTKDSLSSPNFGEIFDNITPAFGGANAPITDTMNWVLVQGSFYAEGGEQWITLGNFSSRNDTDVVKVRTNGRDIAYYYIDMVELCEIPKPPQTIPNIITPNGDGINDVWYITGLFPKSRLVIYNRWGDEVFKTDEYQNNWGGTTTTLGLASTLNAGVYFYVLESTCGGRNTGTITIAN